MPLPPPQTTAGPNAPALAALMSWLDPKPVSRTVDGVEQPLCSNGRDVVQNLQLPAAVATSLAKDIDVWLSIGRIGAVPIPETVDATTARIIMQRLRAMAPKPMSPMNPVIGTPVKEGLSKASKIRHREIHSGRIGRQKAKMKKAGEHGGHVIGYTRSNKPIYASHHEDNSKTLSHMKAFNDNEGAHAAAEAFPHYTKHDHVDAAEAHQDAANSQRRDHPSRSDGHMISQAHSLVVVNKLVKKSMSAVEAYATVRTALRA